MFLRRPMQALLLAASLCAGSVHAITYAVDDGTRDSSLISGAGTFTFGNHFTVVPGGETISSISILWGPNSTNGAPITVKLWSDPNSDGNPNDAVVLSLFAGTVTTAGTDLFETYDIPDVTLLLAQSFFVGGTAPSTVHMGTDASPPISNESWVATGSDFAGSSPQNVGTGLLRELMVRASTPAAVPEPGSLALLAIALAFFAVTRRRKKV